MKYLKIKNMNIEKTMEQVGGITDKLSKRIDKIDFNKEYFDENNLNDLKLHLGYTKSYAHFISLKLHNDKFKLERDNSSRKALA